MQSKLTEFEPRDDMAKSIPAWEDAWRVRRTLQAIEFDGQKTLPSFAEA